MKKCYMLLKNYVLLILLISLCFNNLKAGNFNNLKKDTLYIEYNNSFICFNEIIAENESNIFDLDNYLINNIFIPSSLDEGDYTFFVPNAFSPLGEEDNRCVRPCGSKISEHDFEFIIADRWGNVVYKTNYYNPNAKCTSCAKGAWDGTKSKEKNGGGKLLPEGVYLWYCRFHDENGTSYEKHGSITLLK